MPPSVCNIQGVNGIFHFTTCAPTITECPTGSPVTPASASNWDLETSDIFGSPAVPVYVGSLTVGNITTQPNATVANATELTAMLNAEIPGYTFTLVGTEIRYSGYSAVTGNINGGAAADGYDLVWVAA